MAFIYLGWDAIERLAYHLPFATFREFDDPIWRHIVPWIGHHVLHLSRAVTVNGGGDSAYEYIVCSCRLAVGLIAAAVWSVLDSRRTQYRKLHNWLRVCIRYALAAAMLGYGAYKLFQGQFAPLTLGALVSPLGDKSPHGFLWNFMGFSRSYQIFTGAVEFVGAGLLFWRRTTTLGALILIGAMTNVLMLDISYGTFVKITALHLLLLAMFLTLPDLPRLTNVLLLERSVTAGGLGRTSWTHPWMRYIVAGAKAIVVAYLIGTPLVEAYRTSTSIYRSVAERPLHGLYVVERFVRNGEEVAAADARRWQLVAIDALTPTYSALAVRFADETWAYPRCDYDQSKHVVSIRGAGGRKDILTYTQTTEGVLLQGHLDGHVVELSLRSIPEPSFRLTDPSGLRWISRW